MNERVIFDAALQIADPQARRAFVEKACAGKPEMLAAVESLLKSHDAAGSFLDIPAAEQIKTGAADNPEDSAAAVEKTRSYQAGDADDEAGETPPDLSFLQPSSKPGSIGVLGHYEVLQVLGQGGFGIVLKAFDEKLHRLVAIKVMNAQMAATSPPRKRFLREARAAAGIRHENIVQVHSVEELPLPYLVMEFIDGQTLRQKLDGAGPLEVPEVLHIGRQIASGLAAAQAMGLIHRDIKPGNILVEEGLGARDEGRGASHLLSTNSPLAPHPSSLVKITDFGLARAADDASLTRSGTISGTPMYMAPEQALGRALDHRADLFSLGSVLYELTCGRPPFRAPTTVAVLLRVAEDTPRPMQEIIPEIPDWLVAIVTKLHAKKPEDRFQTAKEVADLLARCQTELQTKGEVTCVAIAPSSPVAPRQESRTSLDTDHANDPQATSDVSRAPGLPVAERQGYVDSARRGSPDPAAPADRRSPPPGESTPKDGDLRSSPSAGSGDPRTARSNVARWLVAAATVVLILAVAIVLQRANNTTTANLASREASAPGQAESTDSTNRIAGDDSTKSIASVAANAPLPTRFTNSLGMEFALVPKGKSWLGGGDGNPGDQEVEFQQDFYLGVYEVTQEEWETMMGDNPSLYSHTGQNEEIRKRVKDISDADLKRFPVEHVSWDMAQEFIKRVNEKTKEAGWKYRLPTAVEWEYACRGGPLSDKSQSGFNFYLDKPSNRLLINQANFEEGGGLNMPCTVGSYKPNPLGLYDMYGNVMEWCDDVEVGKEGSPRRQRGGAYGSNATNCVAWYPYYGLPQGRHQSLGLRLARIRIDTDSDRHAAEYVLSIGGNIKIKDNGQERAVTAATELPREAFELTVVRLDYNPKANDEGLAHFKGCKNVMALYLNSANVTDAGLAHFKDCKFLTDLHLNNTQVTDTGLAYFQDCKNLTHLYVTGRVTDAGLVNFKDCKNLTELTLGGTSVTDVGLAYFKDCKNLTTLGLDSPKVSDAGLIHFQNCRNLTTLNLADTLVSDVGLANFQDCKNLTWLALGNTQVRDAGLANFQDCKNLARLVLPNTQVSDAGLIHFKDCKNLTELILGRTRVSDLGLTYFKDCKNLAVLWLNDTQITDTGLVVLENIPSLTELHLGNTRVSLNGHKQLKAALPKCQITWSEPNRSVAESVLALGGTVEIGSLDQPESRPVPVAADLPGDYFQVRRVSLAGVTKPLDPLRPLLALLTFPQFDRLESIDLSGSTGLDYSFLVPIHGLRELTIANAGLNDASLANLPKLTMLQRLVLDGNDIRGEGLPHLSHQPKLIDLSLSHPNLTNLSAENLAELKPLKRLSLAGSGLTNAGIKQLANLPNLESLDLRRTKATATAIDELKAALPKCQIQWDGMKDK